jgi:hypothetical protein
MYIIITFLKSDFGYDIFTIGGFDSWSEAREYATDAGIHDCHIDYTVDKSSFLQNPRWIQQSDAFQRGE